MEVLIPYLLVAWVVETVVLFSTIRPRDAALISMLVGWAFLPVARYPDKVFGTAIGIISSMHALAIPTNLLINKATAIGLGCLLGVVLFDWATLRRFRPAPFDAPMAIWCVLPIISALVNLEPL